MTDETPFAEKLDLAENIEIRPVPEGRKNLRAGLMMLVPTSRAVEVAIRAIPQGHVMSVMELRDELAQLHGADVTCPVTTGVCLRTVAEAAYESLNAGTPIEEIAPVWRVLYAKAPMLKKLSFDPAFIIEQRAHEARSPARNGATHDV